jgi:ribonuclease P/MRP protein subunit POP1
MWLETHLWHAKRFHMSSLWGWKIPISATQKGLRSCYRSERFSNIIFDQSYWRLLEFQGPEESISTVLSEIADPNGVSPIGKRYKNGGKAAQFFAFDPSDVRGYPFGLMGPAICLWKPVSATLSSETISPLCRTVWLWLHPSCEDAAIHSIAFSIARRGLSDLYVSQQNDISMFEIRGPKALGLIQEVFEVSPNTSQTTAALWKSLHGCLSADSIPLGGVLAMSVWDPRLSYAYLCYNFVKAFLN